MTNSSSRSEHAESDDKPAHSLTDASDIEKLYEYTLSFGGCRVVDAQGEYWWFDIDYNEDEAMMIQPPQDSASGLSSDTWIPSTFDEVLNVIGPGSHIHCPLHEWF